MREITNLSKLKETRPRFPEIREIFGKTKVITSFSHLNPNLPSDEVYRNQTLCEMLNRLGIKKDEVLNTAYDNMTAGSDKPPGHKLQFGTINPEILRPEFSYSKQKNIQPVSESSVVNKVLPAFNKKDKKIAEQRLEELFWVIKKNRKIGQASESLLGLRKNLLELIYPDFDNINFVPEVCQTGAITEKNIKVLEALESNGFPFWKMPISILYDTKKTPKDLSSLIKGINKKGGICSVNFDGKNFSFLYAKGENIEISTEDIYMALRNNEMIATVPTMTLGLVTAPQLYHIGGTKWKEYAPALIKLQAEWLGVKEYNNLPITTGGHEPYAVINKQNYLLKGFFVNYLYFGDNLANCSNENKMLKKFGESIS